jgi:hypothetical protein
LLFIIFGCRILRLPKGAGFDLSVSHPPGGLENPNPVKTDKTGTITDYVGKVGDSATMPPGGVSGPKRYVNNNPITVKSTQTLTITAAGHTYQATYTRTLTNVGADGKLNTTLNSHGVNFFPISATTPVITTIR